MKKFKLTDDQCEFTSANGGNIYVLDSLKALSFIINDFGKNGDDKIDLSILANQSECSEDEAEEDNDKTMMSDILYDLENSSSASSIMLNFTQKENDTIISLAGHNINNINIILTDYQKYNLNSGNFIGDNLQFSNNEMKLNPVNTNIEESLPKQKKAI